MKLDLQQDSKTFYRYLKERVEGYSPENNIGPGESTDPVSFIEVGYEYVWDGWVAVVFDTRPGAMSDGEWTEFIEENALQMPQWSKALFEYEGPLDVVLPNGESHSFPAVEEDWCVEKIGEMLVAILKKCREEGLFRKLPLASPCYMGVEHSEGAWGWPDYEDIPRLGVVNPV